MAWETSNLTITDEDSDGAAYVYFPLYAGDVGAPSARAGKQEFVSRRPRCISAFDKTGLTIEIANSGQTASDAVSLAYQIVFCTLPSHGPQDGFKVDHAGETNSAAMDKYLNVDFVDPGSSVFRRIDFPDPGFGGLANIYFRARVSTLWSPSVPVDQWSFEDDPAVTEAHCRLV